MNERINPLDLAKTVPFPAVQKLRSGEGQVVNPFDLSFTWKVKAQDTGFTFSVYEMLIQPGKSIPIHIHPFAEFFYCLEGEIDAMGLDADGKLTWTTVAAGECANAPATAPHGLKNRSGRPAKFLSVSTLEHQQGFDDYLALLESPEGQAMSEQQKQQALMTIFANYKILFLDVENQ